MVSVIPRSTRAVSHSPELSRILRLPAKGPGTYPSGLIEAMSDIYRRPGAGPAMLRDIQAQALYDLACAGGLLGPIRVGAGKTLISLLAPAVLAARRPLLLLPAKLRDKTRREAMVLSQAWQIPGHVRIESYETLGRVGAAKTLDVYCPDLIVADECHKLKNPRAAVTKRVSRYMREHLGRVHFVALSGTITKRSLRDYGHIVHWTLPYEDAPIPRGWAEIEDWSLALDERPGRELETIHPGALSLLADAFGVGAGDGKARAREGFSRRLRATVGVVASSDISVGASLAIQAMPTPPPAKVEAALATLRSDWVLPSEDAEPLTDALSLWRYVRQLALGFFYVWDPPPPKAWMLARKVWARECRAILSDNRRHLDSELQVAQAVDAGHYPSASRWLEEWRQIRPSFKPTTVPVWLSDFAVTAAMRWATDSRGAPPGIIWTEHQAFAEALAKASHMPYFGAGGVDSTGRPIESVQGKETVIASVEANAEGRNLQAWSRNLVASPMPNGVRWEQLLGRTHRDGQQADEVTCDVMVSVPEHTQAMAQAMADGRYQAQITGQNQKLLYADLIGFDL